MSFLKKLFGRKLDSKIELIQKLVRRRAENDPFAKHLVKEVDGLSEFELMGLPEGTIVTIVESYELMTKRQGLSSDEALELIESHRAMAASGEIPTPLTLTNYIRYRLELDHPDGVPPADVEVEEAIHEAKNFFSQFL